MSSIRLNCGEYEFVAERLPQCSTGVSDLASHSAATNVDAEATSEPRLLKSADCNGLGDRFSVLDSYLRMVSQPKSTSILPGLFGALTA